MTYSLLKGLRVSGKMLWPELVPRSDVLVHNPHPLGMDALSVNFLVETYLAASPVAELRSRLM